MCVTSAPIARKIAFCTWCRSKAYSKPSLPNDSFRLTTRSGSIRAISRRSVAYRVCMRTPRSRPCASASGAFGVVDDRERQARLNFVGAAVQRIVPSVFIATVLSNSLSAAVTREVIENGVNAVPKSNQLTVVAVPKVGKFDVAVVGALGPHKGLNFLLEVVAALSPELRVVVIGYADGQVTPGWLRGARLWVHGAFEPDDLAAIIRSYGVRIAFFPNRQPESYSYALSDVWRAGLPALGPAAGAIGDRLSKTGAGWIYGADSSAPSVATTLRRCLRETATRAADVAAAATALPSTGDMVQRLNQQYEKIMMTRLKFGSEPEVTPRMKTLETLAATQLNARFFRGGGLPSWRLRSPGAKPKLPASKRRAWSNMKTPRQRDSWIAR